MSNIAEERNNELKDRSIANIQSKTQREKQTNKQNTENNYSQ